MANFTLPRIFQNSSTKMSLIKQYYNRAAPPMDTIKEKLLQFPGGSVDLQLLDEVAIVTLNHEAKRNAISGKMMADLSGVVDSLTHWTGKGLVLKGENGSFCSGGDLDFARKTGTAEEGFEMAVFMQDVLSRFQRLPMLSVALIEGAGALGGGAEIATACDYRLISETCSGIGFVHGRLGIVPAWGGTNRLARITGVRRAMDLLVTAKVVRPTECLQIGLVDGVIPSDINEQDYTLEWLSHKTKCSSQVISAIKATLDLVPTSQQLEEERRIFAPLWGGEENSQALKKNIKHKE